MNKTKKQLQDELLALTKRLEEIETFYYYKKGAVDYLNWQVRMNAALTALYKPLISPNSSIEEITRVILEQAKYLTGSQHGYVSYIEPVSKDMVAYTLTEMLGDRCQVKGKDQNIVFPIGKNGRYPKLWGHSLNIRQAFFTNSPSGHPASGGIPKGHLQIDRFLSSPVMLGEEIVGQISLANPLRDYTDQDLEAVRRLGEFYALAVQRKHSEDSLRVSEKKYRMLFEEAIDGIGVADTETGIIIDCNVALCKMAGREKSELIGHHQRILHPPQCVDNKFSTTFKQHLEKHGGQVLEDQLLTKTGEIKDVAIKSNILDWNGSKCIQGIFRDITEKKQAENELNKHRERLEELVKERTEELSAANEKLRHKQKMEAIGTLAGGIAHDFNNILGVIFGYTELVRLKVPNSPAVNDLARIMAAAERAKALVKQILTFSRKTKEERKPILLSEIIDETVKFLRSTLSANIEISTIIDSDLRPLMADPTQMSQVLMNICTNAAYAMRENGGLLKIELKEIVHRQNQLHIAGAPNLAVGKYQLLSIGDTGCGIPPEMLERIFEPYFTSKGLGEGTGLGLAVVHGIVKSHGGEIFVESPPGIGAAFHVYFPISIADTDTTTVECIPSNELVTGKGERILFVDDEQMQADLGKQVLESIGYQVTPCTGSVQALEIFQEDPRQFDLLVTDITMPKIDGFQLAAKFKRIRPDFPVILCTGHNEFMDEANIKSSGVNALVLKPLRIDEIAEIIGNVFSTPAMKLI